MKTLVYFPNYLLYQSNENFLSGLIHLSDELKADYFVPFISIKNIGILNYTKDLFSIIRGVLITKKRIKYNPKLVFSLDLANKYDLVLIINNFDERLHKDLTTLLKIKTNVAFHTFEYHYKTEVLKNVLKSLKPEIILSYGYQEKNCSYFKYLLKDINFKPQKGFIPFYFGYSLSYSPSSFLKDIKRKYNCCLLGSSQPLNIDNKEYKIYSDYFLKNGIHQTHQTRNSLLKLLKENKNYEKFIFAPSSGWRSKDRMSYNNKEILSTSNFFINDLSILKFPPARLFEGIARGCIPIDYFDEIYIQLGFEKNKNIIFLEYGEELKQIKELYFFDPLKIKKMREEVIKMAIERFSQKTISNESAYLIKKKFFKS